MTLRVSLFCSHYYGLSILETTLKLRSVFPDIQIVGVVSDDPTQSFTSPKKRLWRHPHEKHEETMVVELAAKYGIPVWRDRIKTPEFEKIFTEEWAPDVCYMSVFGQRVQKALWDYPLYGFFNFHPCSGLVWPSDTGPHAVEGMSSAGRSQGAVAMHRVDDLFDHGDLVAFSPFFNLVANEPVLDTFKRTRLFAGKMAGWHLAQIHGTSLREYPTPRVVVPEQLPYASYADEIMPIASGITFNRSAG